MLRGIEGGRTIRAEGGRDRIVFLCDPIYVAHPHTYIFIIERKGRQ